jgi:hypothetical protein
VPESILLWAGLGLAAGIVAAQGWMATGRPLVVPPRARTVTSWACMVLGAVYLGFAIGDAMLRQPAGALAIRPTGLGAALLVISLAAFYSASWHLMWVLREDEQARRAGERAQRAVLAELRALGVEPALRGAGYADWSATAERLDAGLAVGVFVGAERARATDLLEHCRVLAAAPSVLPLRLRADDAGTPSELRELERIARPQRSPRRPAKRS